MIEIVLFLIIALIVFAAVSSVVLYIGGCIVLMCELVCTKLGIDGGKQ